MLKRAVVIGFVLAPVVWLQTQANARQDNEKLKIDCGEDVITCHHDAQGNIVPTVINGTELDHAKWKHVVRIRFEKTSCSATIVGPKVLITAAHCGTNGAVAHFITGNTSFKGHFEGSSLYPSQDHDLAVLILEKEVPKELIGQFARVGGRAIIGNQYFLAGYGCFQEGGTGFGDGKLRGGMARMSGTSGFDMATGGPGQVALCFGDSGGPLFTSSDPTNPILLGVNSKGNVRDYNLNLRLDTQASKDFLVSISEKHHVQICGINGDEETCGHGSNNEPIPAPSPSPQPACSATTKRQLMQKIAECFEIPAEMTIFD